MITIFEVPYCIDLLILTVSTYVLCVVLVMMMKYDVVKTTIRAILR